MTTTNPTNTKVIYFQTNFNNKLACEKMLHIDHAPRGPISLFRLPDTIIEIRTKDNSYPESHWTLVDLALLELHELTTMTTWTSHGMDCADYWQDAKKNGLTGATKVAIYYYQRHRS